MVVSEKMSTFASMIDERAYELALSQLAQAREEKMLLFEQVKRLTEEVALLRSSSSNQADQQAETTRGTGDGYLFHRKPKSVIINS